MNTIVQNQKVFVALSGGVDSAVSAALLKEQGYEVTGVYMKNWSGDDFGIQTDCPWEKDIEDVEQICKSLSIPFRSFNFEKEYREKVVEYFFDEYKRGRTPNPDVMCNKEIKFHLFLNRAIEEGADLIATGHYVRRKVRHLTPTTHNTHPITSYKLLKGVDNKKDQSYFLYGLTQDQLSKCLFPIGHLEKSKVRELAQKFQLPVADKPDSQGICFIGEIDVQEFLRQRITPHKGDIVDIDSKEKVGEHDGIEFFTIGQREGLKIGGTSKPYFVVDKNSDTNTLFVGMGSDHPALYRKELVLENLHLIDDGIEIKDLVGKELQGAIRYRQKPTEVKLGIRPPAEGWSTSGGKLETEQKQLVAIFEKPQRAVTPGQNLVIYDGDICLGGGVILAD